LKNGKNNFIEAKIYKLRESVIPHQTLFQHQLGYVAYVAYHLTSKPLHTKRDKHHFYVWNLSKCKT